jgi:hypothetical protein
MPLAPSHNIRLQRLCSLFSIPLGLTKDNPDGGYTIVSLLYTMPAQPDHNQRRQLGNDILKSAYAEFPPSDGPSAAQFFSLTQARVIEMQEFPGWYAELSRSGEELVRIYKNMQIGILALQVLGVGATYGAVSAGIKEATKKPGPIDYKAFFKTTGSRLAGKGPILEGLEARYGANLPRAALLSRGLLVAAAWGAYLALSEEMRKIKIIILDRFQNNTLHKDKKRNDELYKEVFKEIDPTDVKKYWERDK